MRSNRLRFEDQTLDTVDAQILECLFANARTSLADLGRAVGLSAPSVSERLRRLEEAGVIDGYTVTVNPETVGLTVQAILRVRPMPGELARVAEILRAMPEIVECDRITGDDCFLARAQVGSIGDLEAVIDEIIPFAMTHTSIVQSSPVRRRLPPLPTIQAVGRR